MRGTYQVVVRNNRVQFKFEVSRNITIIRGDSATGKTTLIGMVADYERNGAARGIELLCDVPCVVLEGPRWEWYEKKELNPSYLQKREMGAIVGELPEDLGVAR